MKNTEDFATLARLIKNRRAIFPVQYSQEIISREFIDEVLELANWAPTHRRTEPWRFKVINGDHKTRLGKFLQDTYKIITPQENYNPVKVRKMMSKCEASQYIILICMQRDPMERLPDWEEIAAVSMAVQNMWLACSAAGVGCYWSSPKLIEYMNEFMPLKEGERCLGLFYVGGFEGEWPEGSRGPIGYKIQYFD